MLLKKVGKNKKTIPSPRKKRAPESLDSTVAWRLEESSGERKRVSKT